MKTIAICGKGGTGKSTITTLVIKWLSEHKNKSILAVDADANTNLHYLLGITIKDTIGSIRDELKKHASSLPGGMTKHQFIEYKIQTSLIETPNFDFIAMGHPEGPGCYCYANNLLREILSELSKNYEYIVIDNEAGMEHLNRNTNLNVNCLLIVSDPNIRGIRTAGNISKTANNLDYDIMEEHLILNRASESIPEQIMNCIKDEDMVITGVIPFDQEMLRYDYEQTPVWNELTTTSAYEAMGKILKEIAVLN